MTRRRRWSSCSARSRSPLFNELLADMAQNHREVGEVRAQFLRQHREIWSHWVPAEVATRLDTSLK